MCLLFQARGGEPAHDRCSVAKLQTVAGEVEPSGRKIAGVSSCVCFNILHDVLSGKALAPRSRRPNCVPLRRLVVMNGFVVLQCGKLSLQILATKRRKLFTKG